MVTTKPIIPSFVCANCGKEIPEKSRFASVKGEILCVRCHPAIRRATALLRYQDKAHILLDMLRPGDLSVGIHALDTLLGMTIVRPADETDTVFSATLIERRRSDTLVLFSQKRTWTELLEQPSQIQGLSLLPESSRLILQDRSGNVIGMTDKVLEEYKLLQDASIEKPVHCRPFSELKAEYQKITLCLKVREALKSLSADDLLAFCQQRIQGQGLQLRRAVLLVWRYFLDVASAKPIRACSWFLTAPSGSGKTEFYRTIRAFCKQHGVPLPIVQIDLSNVTEAGYRGKNVSDIPKKMLEADMTSGGYGICFLDEADKKLLPSITAKGNDFNAAVQANLLTYIEGIEETVEIKETDVPFDTNKTMFVLMGAFQSLRDERQKQATRSQTIGFSSSSAEADPTEAFYRDLTMEDIIAYGMQEELAGRITQIINFHPLTEEDMRRLLRCKAEEIGEEIGCAITLTKQAETELLEISYGNLGVRHPMNRIRELAMNAIAEVYFGSGLELSNSRIILDSLTHARIIPMKKKHTASKRAAAESV